MLNVRSLLAATVLAGTALASAPAFAGETDAPADITVSGYVQGVTDYRFRGLSLSGGDFAVQGSINVNHSSGLYAGAWASNLEENNGYGSAELDLYVGYSREVIPGLTADIGLTYYAYPNSGVGDDLNVFEPYASVSGAIGPVNAKLGLAYAWKQDSLFGDDNLYVYTDLSAGIPNTPVSVNAHLGYTDGALSPKLLTGVSTDGGFDYSVGATVNITPKLSIGASYVGVDGASFDSFSNDAVVGTLKLSF